MCYFSSSANIKIFISLMIMSSHISWVGKEIKVSVHKTKHKKDWMNVTVYICFVFSSLQHPGWLVGGAGDPTGTQPLRADRWREPAGLGKYIY